MDIDTMPAGREMDALVAEKVMGLHVERIDGHPMWVGQDLPGSPYLLKDGRQAHSLRAYSTDIVAAWEVVKKVGLFRNCFHLHEAAVGIQDGPKWTRTGWEWVVEQVLQPVGQNSVLGRGETAPIAICRAALNPYTRDFNQG